VFRRASGQGRATPRRATRRTLAVEHDAVDHRFGSEAEVRSLQCRPQIGAPGAGAAAADLLTPALPLWAKRVKPYLST